MACGGIHDQVGGGFARYSVDAVWLVPHFEKMLYDNALLARAFLHGYQALGHERWRAVCERHARLGPARDARPGGRVLLGARRRFRGRGGAFLRLERGRAAARSWTRPASGSEADELLAWWGVSEAGNFEGRNILHVPAGPDAEPPAGLDRGAQALYERALGARLARARRQADLSWNALVIAALADAGAVLGRADYLEAADALRRVRPARMRGADGELLRTWKNGEAPMNAYLEDHAYLVEALRCCTRRPSTLRWFDAARETADAMIERFADPERGGFFTTATRRTRS